MLDIGWSELLVIGIVALLVVGPKELPVLLRTVGQWVGKARGMAREFQRSFEDAAREADVKEFTDIKRDIEDVARTDFSTQAKRSAGYLDAGKTHAPAAKPAGETTAAASPAPAPAAPATPSVAGEGQGATAVPPAESPAKSTGTDRA